MQIRNVHRLLPKLTAIAALLFALPANAQVASDAGAQVCAPLERELASSRKNAEAAREQAASAEQRAAECASELSTTSGKAQQCSEASAQCESTKSHQCGATAAFVDELMKGRTSGAAETGCVTPEQQARLDAIVGGWEASSSSIAQIAAYEAGEVSALPMAHNGNTPADRALQRLLRGSGGRAFHRRLLIEALELIAPQTWGKIRKSGPNAIDTWLTTSAVLEKELVAEAQKPRVPGASGPPLTAALHLVSAFQIAAKCTAGETTAECGRAQQLRNLLESSGTLVVRRRIEDIWATECETMSSAAALRWVEDFPGAHLGEGSSDAWTEISENAYAKMLACYLDNASEHASFGVYLNNHLPAATTLNTERLRRVDSIRARWQDTSPAAACARAVRAMQNLALPSTCAMPAGDFRPALASWAQASDKLGEADFPLAMCNQFAHLLWEGKAASISGAFARPPSLDDMVVAAATPPTPMWRLRQHCEERRGSGDVFASSIADLASFGRSFGEGLDRAPYRVDPVTLKPVELVRYESVGGTREWFEHVARNKSACATIGITSERCIECGKVAPGAGYDCSLVNKLSTSWEERSRAVFGAVLALVLTVVLATWLRRMLTARKAFATWARETSSFFDGIGLACTRDRWRYVFPSRQDAIMLALPSEPSWERWGKTAVVVRTPPGPRVRESDVNHAAFVARRAGASVVLLEHDDDAGPDLSAVRAMLEWAAKGGEKAMQILPIGVSRARWSKSAVDVLALVEESSLRGNPFELRGRIATSTQFFNRERLVSGLLASAQAGHWTVVTGLRRFGKSSLGLEIARRLTGPSAYVDVASFDYEIAHGTDPAEAADAILRFVCMRLHESASDRFPKANLPASLAEGARMDAATLGRWLRDLSRAVRDASGNQAPMLVILDELEQALAVGPERLSHALDVLAIVIGRLKGAVGDSAMPDGGSPIGVILSSALHPLLWAPLRSLAHQSIMGSFPRVCVPCLGSEAATTMMRSLGARQGVRFTDEALAKVVEESQGVPLLLRRLGGSILELYDAERARQGSLGAVEIGIEGTIEAVARENREGSPLRVWVETEIAARNTVPGALLRTLAHAETVDIKVLHDVAKKAILVDFERTGISAALAPDEVARRAEEAAHVIVDLLEESGLVVPYGDLTAPDGYSLPEGAIRSVLRAQAAVV